MVSLTVLKSTVLMETLHKLRTQETTTPTVMRLMMVTKMQTETELSMRAKLTQLEERTQVTRTTMVSRTGKRTSHAPNGTSQIPTSVASTTGMSETLATGPILAILW